MEQRDFSQWKCKILNDCFGYKLNETTAVYYGKFGTLYFSNCGFYVGIKAHGMIHMTTKYDEISKIETYDLKSLEGQNALKVLTN